MVPPYALCQRPASAVPKRANINRASCPSSPPSGLHLSPSRFTVKYTFLMLPGALVSHSSSRPYLPWLLLLIGATVPVTTAAQQPAEPIDAPTQPWTAQPWTAPHFSIDPKALYQAASGVTAPDDANIAELLDDETYTFDEQGRAVHVGHFVYKVLTQKGAENWDALAVGWEPWHEARPIIRARVIAPDFTVRTLDPATITEAPARGGDYKTYSDGKTLHVPLPAIAPGAVVEEEFTETETEPLFVPGRVGRIAFGQVDVPVAHSHAVLDAPSSL